MQKKESMTWGLEDWERMSRKKEKKRMKKEWGMPTGIMGHSGKKQYLYYAICNSDA